MVSLYKFMAVNLQGPSTPPKACCFSTRLSPPRSGLRRSPARTTSTPPASGFIRSPPTCPRAWAPPATASLCHLYRQNPSSPGTCGGASGSPEALPLSTVARSASLHRGAPGRSRPPSRSTQALRLPSRSCPCSAARRMVRPPLPPTPGGIGTAVSLAVLAPRCPRLEPHSGAVRAHQAPRGDLLARTFS